MSALKLQDVLRLVAPRMIEVTSSLEEYQVRTTGDPAVIHSLQTHVTNKLTIAGNTLALALARNIPWLPEKEVTVNSRPS